MQLIGYCLSLSVFSSPESLSFILILCWGSIQDVYGVSASDFDQLDLGLWRHWNRNASSTPISFCRREPWSSCSNRVSQWLKQLKIIFFWCGPHLVCVCSLSFCWRGQKIKNAKSEPHIKRHAILQLQELYAQSAQEEREHKSTPKVKY